MQALSEAWNEDSGTPAEAPSQAAPSEGQVTSNQEAEKPSGLFYDVDPSKLTPELRQMFDGMQKSFTEKNQALAEERKRYEAFGGLEAVEQAVGFVQSLNDPQNLVQLHSELSTYLQEAGYTKAEADAAATSAVTEQTQSQETDYAFEDPQVAQLKSELAALNEWKQGFEAQQEQARIEQSIKETEFALRQERSYTDDDVARLYQLAWAHGADLRAAADAYDQMKQDFISSYINQKAEAPSATSGIYATAHGQKPESFGSDFEAAHKHAKAIAIAMQNAGELD